MLNKLLDRIFGRAAAPALNPDAAALVRAAERIEREGRLSDALEAYHRALDADALALDAHIGMGNVMVDLWMLDEAVAAYGRAQALAPQSAA